MKTATDESKKKYYSRLSDKLLKSKTSPKLFWSILKTFPNNKKIPSISPLLHNGKFKKADLFDGFFTKTYSLVINYSELPSIITKKTCKSLSTVEFLINILKTIRILNPSMFNSCLEKIQKIFKYNKLELNNYCPTSWMPVYV